MEAATVQELKKNLASVREQNQRGATILEDLLNHEESVLVREIITEAHVAIIVREEKTSSGKNMLTIYCPNGCFYRIETTEGFLSRIAMHLVADEVFVSVKDVVKYITPQYIFDAITSKATRV